MPQAVPILAMAGAAMAKSLVAKIILTAVAYAATDYNRAKIDSALREKSQNLSGDEPIVTVSKDTPIPYIAGMNLISGNIVRQNAFNEEDYISCLVDYGEGEWDDFMGHFINGNNFWDLKDDHTKWEHLGTIDQSGITNLWTTDACNFRNNVIVEYKLKKGDELNGLSNIQALARTKKFLEIGQDIGGTESFTRNPAQILWDFYLKIKEVAIAELDENAFNSLYDYCFTSLCNTDPTYYEIGVPCANSENVTGTSYYKNQKPCRIAEYGNSVIGGFDKSGTVCWASENITNQRINFDFGRKTVITALWLWNYHKAGTEVDRGIYHFDFQGSNERSDFLHTTFSDSGSTWTNIQTGLSIDAHASSDIEGRTGVYISNTTGYRYYSLKIADNHGDNDFIGLRHILFWTGNAASACTNDETNIRYAFDYPFDTKITINDAEKLLWQSFNGQVIRSQGKYKPVWDAAEEADGSGGLQTKAVKHTFTVGGTSGNVIKDSFSWGKIDNKPNVFIVNYRDHCKNFSKEMVIYKNEEDIAIRGEITYEETAYYLIDRALASRRCKLNHNKMTYPDYWAHLTGFPDSQILELYDRVAVTDTEAGWSAKDFIITDKDEDQYGRPIYSLEAYLSGVYDDKGFEYQPGYATRPMDPNKVLPAPEGDDITATAVNGTASDSAINGPIHITFEVPTSPTYSYTEIWVSTDDTNYYKAIEDSDGDCLINGLGVYWDYGDIVYIKMVHVTVTGVKSAFPTTYQTSVNTASAVAKYAGFYFGPYDIWGGDGDLTNAATKIVIGGINDTVKIALGGSADSMDVGNMSTYPGAYIDGAGNFRVGGATYGLRYPIADNVLYVDPKMRVGNSISYIDLDGVNYRIRSSNYVSGYLGAGFTLEPDLLEVGNAVVRGVIHASVFQKDSISVIGGNMLLRPADVLAMDMTSEDLSDSAPLLLEDDTEYLLEDDTEYLLEGLSGSAVIIIKGDETFAVGDILRIKDGTEDEWLIVTNASSAPIYGVTRDCAAQYSSNNNPAWTKGTTVTNYGQSGDGGIYYTACETNAPYMSVYTINSTPWNSGITTQLRLGNLNGYAGYVTDTYGFAAYIDANNYIKIDAVNGIRMSGTITLTNTISADSIIDGSTNHVFLATDDSKLAGIEAGADVTSAHSQAVAWLTDAGDLATADDLDDVPNGSTYGKVLNTNISAGTILLSACSGNLDNIANGSTYAKVQAAILDSGYLYLMRKNGSSANELLITSSGVEGYANSVKNFELANGIAYLGNQSSLHTKASSSGVQIYNNTTLLSSFSSSELAFYGGATKVISILNTGVGSINLLNGSDIILTGNASSTAAKITFNGTSYDTELFCSASGGVMYFLPDTDEAVDLYVGLSGQKYHYMFFECSDYAEMIVGTSYFKFSSTYLYPHPDDTLDCGIIGSRWDDIYATNGTIQTSDERLKKDIRDSELGYDFIMKINPISFIRGDTIVPEVYEETEDEEGNRIQNLKEKSKIITHSRRHYGLSAQQIAEALKGVGIDTDDFAGFIYDEDADRYGLRYDEFLGPMIKAFQTLADKYENHLNEYHS